MSEEEIIEYIEDEIENDTDTYHWFDNTPDNNTRKQISESINAHQGLLDLYQKEKKKNKELEEENKNLNISLLQFIIGQIPDTCEKYKKYKKELEELLQEER